MERKDGIDETREENANECSKCLNKRTSTCDLALTFTGYLYEPAYQRYNTRNHDIVEAKIREENKSSKYCTFKIEDNDALNNTDRLESTYLIKIENCVENF